MNEGEVGPGERGELAGWWGWGSLQRIHFLQCFPSQAPGSRLPAAEEAFVMEIPGMEFNPENNPEPGPPCSAGPPVLLPLLLPPPLPQLTPPQ